MKGKIRSKIKLLILNLFGEEVYTELYAFYQAKRLQKKKNKYLEAEVSLLPRFVHSGDVVIDIGANFGQYTYPLSKLVGLSGKVYSFEPVKYTFKILQNIIKKLELTNVELQNVALGETNGEFEFIVPVNNFGIRDIYCSHLYDRKEKIKGIKEKVKVVTLDEFRVKLPILDGATFIKCDVEGQELMIFKGGRTFLSKCLPIILCEIEEKHTQRYGYNPEDIFSFLKNFGYKAFVFISNELIPTQEIRNSINNYIFIPQNLVSKFI